MRDHDALVNEAWTRHRARVFSFLLRLSRRRAIAEELVQETFLRLAKSAPTLPRDADVRAWLFTVARNAFVSHRRVAMFDMGRFVELERDEHPEAETPVDARVEARMRLSALERALSALAAADREVLLLCAVEGFEPTEAATILGVRADAVRQRLLRARARLAREMESEQSAVSKSEVTRARA